MFLSHFLFFTKQSGGNYDALQFCITYLPICLASSSPSSVVLGFCLFHLVFRVLNFCRVTWCKVQRQFGFFVVSRAFHYALRVKICRCINVQKSFSLSENQLNTGSGTKEKHWFYIRVMVQTFHVCSSWQQTTLVQTSNNVWADVL